MNPGSKSVVAQSSSTLAPTSEIVDPADVRAAIGKHGGGLKDVPPADLLAEPSAA